MSGEKQFEGIEPQPDEKKEKKGNIWIELVIYVILIVLCVVVVPRYVIQRTVVDGESMESNLYDGESLLVEKVSKHFTDPKRYDIIVFDPPKSLKEGDKYFVKRVIGLPGETIQIKGNDILINGEKIEDGYGKMAMDDMDNETAAEPLTLADDEFFVLGDNREVSEDSRYALLGPIKRDMLVGKCLLRIWPLSHFGVPK